MSYVFNVEDEEVWRTTTQVGDFYVRFVGQVANLLDVSTGLTSVTANLSQVDIDVYSDFVRSMVSFYLSTNHSILHGLIEGILKPSVEILDRAGRPLSPQSEIERKLMARLREREY
jgi:hypothetical protein